MKNSFNFPAKNQGKDNTHSIFNEENFKCLDSDYLLLQMISPSNDEKQNKHLLTPSTELLQNFFDVNSIPRINLRRASSLKTEEETDELTKTNSPSPRLKSILNLKKRTNLMNVQNYLQFSLFYHEKQKIDRINHNLSFQTPSRVLSERIMITLNNSNILTFLKSQKEEKMYIISKVFFYQ